MKYNYGFYKLQQHKVLSKGINLTSKINGLNRNKAKTIAENKPTKHLFTYKDKFKYNFYSVFFTI